MKRRNIAFTVVLLVSACGRLPDQFAAHLSENEFGPFAQYFIDAGKSRGEDLTAITSNIPIAFGKLGSEENGRCVTPFIGERHIVINRHLWSLMDDWDKKALITHEMGHCVLNQSHRPQSIMAEKQVAGIFFEARESFYLDELFAH